MAQTVADVLVGVLERVGVRQIFGLIGDSLNPLADSVRHSSIEWIGVRHEEGAALAAAGQAKLTGRLAVCAGTTGPGSNHLVAGLYEAAHDHAPVLAISGEMPRKLHGIDYFQSTKPISCFAMSKYHKVSYWHKWDFAPCPRYGRYRSGMCCKTRPIGVRPTEMGNNRTCKSGFLNQNSLGRVLICGRPTKCKRFLKKIDA